MSEGLKIGMVPTCARDLEIDEGFQEIHKGMSGVIYTHKDRQEGFDLIRGASLNNGQSDTLVKYVGREHMYIPFRTHLVVTNHLPPSRQDVSFACQLHIRRSD
jgi:hypothetical protein